MGYVRTWITEAKCIDCGGIYKIDPYHPLKRRCKKCAKANKKRVKRTDRIQIISFLIFPVGFLLYFLLKDKKPHYAQAAFNAAMIPAKILIGLILLVLIVYIIVLNV